MEVLEKARHTMGFKSDDVYGRDKIFEAIVKGVAAIVPGVFESFNVLIRELQCLSLSLSLSGCTADEEALRGPGTVRAAEK